MIPSLLQIPSAVSDSKLHSVLPNNGKGDFTFDRCTGATRINRDGLIEEVGYFSTEKLTGFTNGTTYAFTTFTTSGNNITSAIVSSAFAGAVSNAISVTSGQTYRVTFDYTKNSGNDLRVVFSSSANGAGTQISNNHLVSSSGSYSFDFTITSTTTGYLQMGTGNSGHSLNASINNVSVKEVQGDRARLSYDITNGVVEDQPHLLLEPSSTNLITFSKDFSQSVWAKSGAGTASAPAVTTNFAISPDGTQNASRVIFDLNGGTSSSDFSQLQCNVTASSGVSHTTSIYMKSNNSNTYNVTIVDVAGSTHIVSVTSEWQRFDKTATLSSSNMRIRTRGSESSSDVTDILIYGAQLEQQSYATSFIPTGGLTITRAAETCNNSKPSVNSTEGVLYAEIGALADDGTFRLVSVSDGTNNNTVKLGYRSDSNNIYYEVRVSGSATAFQLYSTSDITQFHKVAVKYKVNDFAMWVNGTQVLTDTSGAVPTGLNSVQFTRGDSDSIFYGKVKGLAVYNEALTDAQLTTLTS
jgi:hypothetical protein